MNLEQARYNMIEQQIRPWDVLDQRVLDVFAETPRERFVPEQHKSLAYMDLEIPLEFGESMMSPKVEGRVLQALDAQPTDTALEIGTGSGYLTACLARLAGRVYSVDIHESFKYQAAARLQDLGLDNVILRSGDASKGWPQLPRYDVIAVTGSLPEYSNCFEKNLSLGGRLFVVVGEAPVMEAMLVTRVGENEFARTKLFETTLKALSNTHKVPQFTL